MRKFSCSTTNKYFQYSSLCIFGFKFFALSSQQRCSVKPRVFKNFTKFTGKNLCQSLFFHKSAGLRPASY